MTTKIQVREITALSENTTIVVAEGVKLSSFFTHLNDTPSNYIGAAKKYPVVKDAEDGLEFMSLAEDVAFVDHEDRIKTNTDKISVMEDRSFIMTQTQSGAIRNRNKETFVASGMVHNGKHIIAGSGYNPINEGLHTTPLIMNQLRLGRPTSAATTTGTSKTDFAVTHIAGAVSNIIDMNVDASYAESLILFPQAEDGTRTYNTATGVQTQHVDSVTAFAYAGATTDEEVVTERHDMFGLEQWQEVISTVVGEDEIFPTMVQNASITFGDTGIPTVVSTRPQTYFAAYDGHAADIGRCVLWSSLTEQERKLVAEYLGENLFVNSDGDLVQTRIRQRTVAGIGNGDWFNVNWANHAEYIEVTASSRYLMAQGSKDLPATGSSVNSAISGAAIYGSRVTTFTQWNDPEFKDIGLFKASGAYGFAPFSGAYNGECYFYVMGTVARLNQGGYHPSFNPMGACAYRRNATGGYLPWSDPSVKSGGVAWEIQSTQDCFRRTGDATNSWMFEWSGAIGGTSGRDDGRFYDAIYAGGQGGVIDYRKSAYDMSSPEEAAKIWEKVDNGTYRGEEEIVRTQVFSSVAAVPSGWVIQNQDNTSAVVAYTNTGYSVSADFTNQVVFSDPTNLLTCPDLVNGWHGIWGGIPDGTSGFLVRKQKGNNRLQALKTVSPFTAWTTEVGCVETTENDTDQVLTVGGIYIFPMTNFAGQTKNSTNKPVMNGSQGVGDVLVTDSYEMSKGVFLNESLTGKIGTGSVHTSLTVMRKTIEGGLLTEYETMAYTGTPEDSRIVCKQISDNGQCSLAFDDGTNYHDLSIPTGYTHNRARAGTQVAGVDL